MADIDTSQLPSTYLKVLEEIEERDNPKIVKIKGVAETHSDFKKIENSKRNAVYHLGLIKDIEFLPWDLKKKTIALLEEAEEYKIEQHKPETKPLKGKFFNIKKIKEIVQNATGYIWEVREYDNEEMDEHDYNAEEVEYMFGVQAKEGELRGFEFYRDSKSRDEAWLLNVILLRGCCFIEWSTGRVDGRTKLMYSIEDIDKELGGL